MAKMTILVLALAVSALILTAGGIGAQVDTGNVATAMEDVALLFDSDCIPAEDCCKICKKGKACGDACIRKDYTCYKARGCACNSYEVCED